MINQIIHIYRLKLFRTLIFVSQQIFESWLSLSFRHISHSSIDEFFPKSTLVLHKVIEEVLIGCIRVKYLEADESVQNLGDVWSTAAVQSLHQLPSADQRLDLVDGGKIALGEESE